MLAMSPTNTRELLAKMAGVFAPSIVVNRSRARPVGFFRGFDLEAVLSGGKAAAR